MTETEIGQQRKNERLTETQDRETYNRDRERSSETQPETEIGHHKQREASTGRERPTDIRKSCNRDREAQQRHNERDQQTHRTKET